MMGLCRRPRIRVRFRTGALLCVVTACGVVCPGARGQFVVDAGGSGTHSSIQAAIDAASDGFDITVMPGIYTERINFHGKAVRVHGSAPMDRNVVAATILDAGGLGRAVIFDSGEGPGSILEGLTVRNGTTADPGGGVSCVAGSSPRILRNLIVGNVSAGNGGGIYCAQAAPEIAHNVILGNRCGARGGGIYCTAGSPVIRDNTIEGNQAGCSAGGGIYLAAGTDAAIVQANEIARNLARLGGGIAVAGSDVRIERNRLINNYGLPRGGAVSISNANVTLVSNVAAGNTAEIAAGLDSAHSSPFLRGNTFVGNWATDEGILLFLGSGQTELTGNVVAFNRAGVGVLAVAGAAVAADYNCWFDNPGGDSSGGVTLGPHNVTIDPSLVGVGVWVPGLLPPDDEVPCNQEERTEMVATFDAPPPVRGFAHYRLRPDRERFDVELYDFPPGGHVVFVAGVNVGSIFVNAGGVGVLEFDTNDGNFPANFPNVFMGDVVAIGVVSDAPLGPAWSGMGDHWMNGDVHLSSGSPLVEAGPGSIPAGDSADLDGQPRLFGAAMDIGADEAVPDGDGDLDADGDVDFADTRTFQLCFRGEAGGLPQPSCYAFDSDGDGDVDLLDWEAFMENVTGPQ